MTKAEQEPILKILQSNQELSTKAFDSLGNRITVLTAKVADVNTEVQVLSARFEAVPTEAMVKGEVTGQVEVACMRAQNKRREEKKLYRQTGSKIKAAVSAPVYTKERAMYLATIVATAAMLIVKGIQ